MANRPDLDRVKRVQSTSSAASNDSMLKRWKSFVKPFAAEDACDHCGRGSCDNGFEGQWDNGVPSVKARASGKPEQDGWPRVLSNSRPAQKQSKPHHSRFASSQAMSSAEGFRITFDMGNNASNDDFARSSRLSVSRDSDSRSFNTAPAGNEDSGAEDDDMGLAQKRRSQRYSYQKSPLSPTFSLSRKDRKADDRRPKSILKRESIRLSALPPMPKSGESLRVHPPGSEGLAMLKGGTSPRARELNDNFVFPQPSPQANNGAPAMPRLVTWNGSLDPENPQNRPLPAKLISTILLLGLALTVTFVSTTLAPISARLAESFKVPSEIIVLASALTVLGFAFGAPLFGALSEKHGRKTPLLLALLVFALFNIPVAVTANLPTLLAFRFFAGLFGAAPLVIVPPALTDLWSSVGRGIATSFFAAVIIIGPVCGGVAGAFLSDVEYPGWRWTAWIGVFLSVFFGLPFALVYKESSASVLLKSRAKHLRRATKDWALHAPAEESSAGLRTSLIKTALVFAGPTMILPTIHMTFAYSVFNLFFVSYGFAFHQGRHWAHGAQDIPLTPIIFGCFVGIFINFIVSKKKYTGVVRQQGSAPPEARIIPWIIGSWILPFGLLLFAWTSSPQMTFIPQLMAGIPSGIGISLILIGGLNYILDTYTALPGLAVAATTVPRCALGFAFPMFASHMYEALDVRWANTTLAIISVVMIPIPILLMKLGPKFRMMGKFAVKPGPPQAAGDAEMAQRDDAAALTVGPAAQTKTKR